jgi:hypothetical protein
MVTPERSPHKVADLIAEWEDMGVVEQMRHGDDFVDPLIAAYRELEEQLETLRSDYDQLLKDLIQRPSERDWQERAEAAEEQLEVRQTLLEDIYAWGANVSAEEGSYILELFERIRPLVVPNPANNPCDECDGKGQYTTWPHTTCPTCGGTGQYPASTEEDRSDG